MQRVQVESSDIVSIGYQAGTLEIEFKSGRVYQYLEVESSVYRQFLAAESIGRYFNAHINNRYRYKHVKEAVAQHAKNQALGCVVEDDVSWEVLQAACSDAEVSLERLKSPGLLEVVQSHDPHHIARQKAAAAYKLLARPVVVQTLLWNIVALRGFPGAYASYVSQWLRPPEVLRLLTESSDRSVVITKTVAYHDGDKSKLFSQELAGTIAARLPQSPGDTLESLTTMAGQTRTITEIVADGQDSPLYSADGAYKDLARWLKMQQKLASYR